MLKKLILLILFLMVMLPVGCKSTSDSNDDNNNDDNENGDDIPTGLLSSSDFTYIGAFRLPDGISEVESFMYGGLAMTYYSNGDPSGANDGYTGSLFIAGHAWEYQLAEVSIPAPKISASKNLEELNTASFLQQFQDIFDVSDLEIPRVGIAYLTKQGSQTSDKLHFCWGYHMQMEPADLTHGWCEVNLSNPQVKRGWYLKGYPVHIQNMSTNDYMFEIPKSWADAYTPGMRLATGRFRDGGWSGQGPALFAIGPWNHGNPPPSGTGINNIPLLLYTSTMDMNGENHTMDNYQNSDEWAGGAWLTAGDKAAVIFAGTKGVGDCWYGDPNGPCENCENRGWWSTSFKGQLIFYNPADFADVAAGTKQSYEPQPYTTMDIDQQLYGITSTQQKSHLGDVAFDRTNGILYVVEYRADSDKCLIHAWKVTGN